MKIGQTLTVKRTFSQQDFNRFAALSGDDNPIHVDPEFSMRTKFGRTVAHGMLLYSLIEHSLSTLLPRPGTVQIFQELVFPNPTFVDQEIVIHLEVNDLPTSQTAEIITNIAQPDGKMGCSGKTLVRLSGTEFPLNDIVFEVPVNKNEVQEHRGMYIGQIAEKIRTFSKEELNIFLDLVDETSLTSRDCDQVRSMGFQDAILPGGLLGGLVSDLLGTQLPGRGTNWLKQKYYFLKPAYPGEEITARVEVIRLRPEKDLVNLRTTLINQKDELLVDGEALVWVSDLEVWNETKD